MKLDILRVRLRALSTLAYQYRGESNNRRINGFEIPLTGYSQAQLTLAVFKELPLKDFAFDQAEYMAFLGEKVCPKILAINNFGYAMEYLMPYIPHPRSLESLEIFLTNYVWNIPLADSPSTKIINDESWRESIKKSINFEVPDWALDEPRVIHGDPTLDNCLLAQDSSLRITDPIPPHRLNKPSIQAVDHGKILQSFLGYETVLRGIPRQEFAWPEFMKGDYIIAQRAVFWAMVAIKRLVFHNLNASMTEWATQVGNELSQLCEVEPCM